MAVKIDEDESSDLQGLLTTLERISTLQSSITATSADIRVQVDNTEVNTKIDELKQFLEEEFELSITDDGSLNDIRRNTDFIISRLWSLYSPMASKEQMTERFLKIGTKAEDVIQKFLENIRDPKILISRYGSIKEGKEKLAGYIKVIVDQITKDLGPGGIFTANTKQMIEVLERIIIGAKDVGAPTIDKLMNLAGGVEEMYQLMLTKLGRGEIDESKDKVLHVGTQFQMGGLTMGNLTQKAYDAFTKGKEKGGFDFTDEQRERMAHYALTGEDPTGTLYEDTLGKHDPKTEWLKPGNAIAPQFTKRYREEGKAANKGNKIAEAFFAKYKNQLRIDELGDLGQAAIAAYLKKDGKFKDYLESKFSEIYDNTELVEGYTKFVMGLFESEIDSIRDKGFLIWENEWKKLAKHKDIGATSREHGYRRALINIVSQGSNIGMTATVEAPTIDELEDRLEKLKANENTKPMDYYRQIFSTMIQMASEKDDENYEKLARILDTATEKIGEIGVIVTDTNNEVGNEVGNN